MPDRFIRRFSTKRSANLSSATISSWCHHLSVASPELDTIIDMLLIQPASLFSPGESLGEDTDADGKLNSFRYPTCNFIWWLWWSPVQKTSGNSAIIDIRPIKKWRCFLLRCFTWVDHCASSALFWIVKGRGFLFAPLCSFAWENKDIIPRSIILPGRLV